MIRARDLRHRVWLEAPAGAPDGGGGIDLSWQPVVALWVEIRAMSGTEQLMFDRANASAIKKITLRFRDGVTADMRFRLNTRIFEIRQVADPDGTGHWLECICEERPQ